MNRHPRIPAVVAMVITAAVGLSLLAVTGQFGGTRSEASLEDLEVLLVERPDATVWTTYGDKLSQLRRFADAAGAYERALELAPDSDDLRLKAGLALAGAGDADKFFDYVTWLTMINPTQAENLMARPEMEGPIRSDPRFTLAAAAAHAQAVD